MLAKIMAGQGDFHKSVLFIIVGGVLAHFLGCALGNSGVLHDLQDGAGAVDGHIAQNSVLAADQVPNLVQHRGGQHCRGGRSGVGKGRVLQLGHIIITAQEVFEKSIVIRLAVSANVLTFRIFQIQPVFVVHLIGQLAVVAQGIERITHLFFFFKLCVKGFNFLGFGLGLAQFAVINQFLRGIQQRFAVITIISQFHCVPLSTSKY